MTLQYRSDTGGLLYHSVGTPVDKLMADCCCPGPCGDCDPALHSSYTITFAGMPTEGGSVNGAWTVSWGFPIECPRWQYLSDVVVGLNRFERGPFWRVQVDNSRWAAEFQLAQAPSNFCNPAGSYIMTYFFDRWGYLDPPASPSCVVS